MLSWHDVVEEIAPAYVQQPGWKEDEGWCLDMEGRRLGNGSDEAVLSSPRNGGVFLQEVK